MPRAHGRATAGAAPSLVDAGGRVLRCRVVVGGPGCSGGKIRLPFDGGGNGKQEPPLDPTRLLTPGGTVVIDDFTPADQWPPLHQGKPDGARIWWLEHPAMRATEVQLAEDLSTIVATRRR